jgi:hypothetical protein
MPLFADLQRYRFAWAVQLGGMVVETNRGKQCCCRLGIQFIAVLIYSPLFLVSISPNLLLFPEFSQWISVAASTRTPSSSGSYAAISCRYPYCFVCINHSSSVSRCFPC